MTTILSVSSTLVALDLLNMVEHVIPAFEMETLVNLYRNKDSRNIPDIITSLWKKAPFEIKIKALEGFSIEQIKVIVESDNKNELDSNHKITDFLVSCFTQDLRKTDFKDRLRMIINKVLGYDDPELLDLIMGSNNLREAKFLLASREVIETAKALV